MTKDKPYKKRVILASSGSEEEDDDQPQAKRIKESSSAVIATPTTTTTTKSTPSAALFPDAKTTMKDDIEMVEPPPPSTTKEEEEAVEKKKKKKLKKDKLKDDDDDDRPLVTKEKEKAKEKEKVKKDEIEPSKKEKKKEKKSKKVKDDDDNVNKEVDSDTPMAEVVKFVEAKSSKSKSDKKEKEKKKQKEEEGGDGSDVPLSQAKKVVNNKPKEKVEKKEKKKEKAVVKEKVATSPKKAAKGKGKAKDGDGGDGDDPGDGDGDGEDGEEEDDEDGPHRWWDAQAQNSDIKWTTLEHAGVMFPPEYEPHGVKLLYNKKPVDLPPEAEEVATFFAALLASDHVAKPVFVKNFFDSFQDVLKLHPPRNKIEIKSFERCDFSLIFDHLEVVKQRRKSLTAAQKKAIKVAKDLEEEPFKTCLLNGRVEKVGNFRLEPPGLFRGRGLHPKTGLLKTRLTAEQVTINLSEGAQVPAPPAGHQWGGVVHNNAVTWLATWKENINNAVKYVYLGQGSIFKGQSDLNKFEKSRALKGFVDQIRRGYTADFRNAEMVIRQRATAIYFIDKFALRNGNEKGDDEADTVGCCSLRYEHITLTPPNQVTFDFLGKDSIRYVNTVEVELQVFKNLKIFKKAPKVIGDLLFDRLNTMMVNKFLQEAMPGLTAKVFRTYNASWTFVQQLADTPADASIADKLLHYNRANRMVAVLCNHQKSVGKNHADVMTRLNDKTLALKFQRKKWRATLHNTPGTRVKYPDYQVDESDLEDDWIQSHEASLYVLEQEKITKKFERENKKRLELNNPEDPVKPDTDLPGLLRKADVVRDKLAAERAEGWINSSRLGEVDLVKALIKLDEKILAQKNSVLDRDEGKEVSLGTSIQNYIDPRITYAWCKKHDVPVAKILSKTLQEKFVWAAETEDDFDW